MAHSGSNSIALVGAYRPACGAGAVRTKVRRPEGR